MLTHNSDGSPARVSLTPDGILEEYTTTPPPFISAANQIITITNIPKTMDNFNSITEDFNGARRKASMAHKPKHHGHHKHHNHHGKGKMAHDNQSGSSSQPTQGHEPSSHQGHGKPHHHEHGQAAVSMNADGMSAKGVMDDLKANSGSYIAWMIAGALVGGMVGNFKDKAGVGIFVGAALGLGGNWVYLNKISVSKEGAPKPEVKATATTTGDGGAKPASASQE